MPGWGFLGQGPWLPVEGSATGLGSGVGLAASLLAKRMGLSPKVSSGISGATLGGSIGGPPGAMIGGALGLLLGGGEEEPATLIEAGEGNAVHRNILPELQALADRYKRQRMARR